MKRPAIAVIFWYGLAVSFFLINTAVVFAYSKTQNTTNPGRALLVASNHTKTSITQTKIISADARSLLLFNFLHKHNSPMTPYADLLVKYADTYGLDFRLTTAIAMCESGAGKALPKKDQYNAFGIAVYTDNHTGKAFDSWAHAIEWVSRYIKETYYDNNRFDLLDIERSWSPPSYASDHSWAYCVNLFTHKIL